MNNALTPAELLAECQAIADLLPPHRDKRVGITVANGCTVQPVLLAISPEGIAGPNASFRSFTGETFAEVFGAARAWCPENCTQRRSRLKQKLAAERGRRRRWRMRRNAGGGAGGGCDGTRATASRHHDRVPAAGADEGELIMKWERSMRSPRHDSL